MLYRKVMNLQQLAKQIARLSENSALAEWRCNCIATCADALHWLSQAIGCCRQSAVCASLSKQHSHGLSTMCSMTSSQAAVHAHKLLCARLTTASVPTCAACAPSCPGTRCAARRCRCRAGCLGPQLAPPGPRRPAAPAPRSHTLGTSARPCWGPPSKRS